MGDSLRTGVMSVIIVALIVLIGFYVHGFVWDANPRDVAYTAESIDVTLHNVTQMSAPANLPILSGSDSLYTENNASMTRNTHYNISYSSGEIWMMTTNMSGNVSINYTFDEWSDLGIEHQNWLDTSTDNINASFVLGSVIAVVLAAVLIVGTVLLIGRKG